MTDSAVFHDSDTDEYRDAEGPLTIGGTFSGDAGDVPFTPAGTISATDVQAAIEEVAAEAGGGSTPTGTGFRHVTSGTEDGASKLVEAADVATSLKPSGTATGTDESLRRLGTGSTHAAAGDDSRFPTTGEKNALAGTSGTPGSGNKYVTDGDSRLTDGRAPTGSAGGVLSGTYPNPGFAADMATQAELDAVAGAAQPLDADLTAIAALDASTAGAISSDGAGWIKKTYSQFKTALSLVKGDVGLGNVDNTADSAKPVSTAQQTAIDAKVTANAGITGATKTKVTYDAKGLVTSGADATTADIADSTNKRYVTDAQQTVIGNTSGTNSGDQTTVSGNAGTATALQTSRNIDGQGFDGTGNITVIAPGTHAATSKATPVDADELALVDSAASNVLKKLTWANLKATLKAYFDTLYSAAGAYVPGGTDVAVADGGTGASTAATARTNLGIPAAVGGTEWTVVTKAIDESNASNTTLQDDDELFFTAAAGKSYEIEAVIIYGSPLGAGTPDIKTLFSEDTTSRGAFWGLGFSTTDTISAQSLLDVSTGTPLAWGTAAADRMITIRANHVGNGGVYKFRWAQNTSGTNATIVRAGSILRYRQLN